MEELADLIRSSASRKAVGPDGVPGGLFKITLNGDIIVGISMGERFRNSEKMPSSKRKIGPRAAGYLAGGSRRHDTATWLDVSMTTVSLWSRT